jgi:TP53 regulating kinase-like protein
MDDIDQLILIKKGAEANLFFGEWNGKKVIAKQRLPKKYRPPELDLRIRRYRTTHEPQLMHEAKRAGVPTPTIFLVDVENNTIIMEHIEGKQVKQILELVSQQQRQDLCSQIGGLVADLHKYGLVHGDLTTSNMIVGNDGRVFFVDFGLGDKTTELEAQGVDLHLLKRALQSTHFHHAEECFTQVLKGYALELGAEKENRICQKIKEIEKRGRYVAERQTDR